MHSDKPLSARAWLRLFALTVLVLALAVAGFNVYTDPYGAFGDRFLSWWSYDMTLNPRLAKITYLDQHPEYDAFLVGSSGSSSYPVDQLNDYLDANFYNCLFYGTEMSAFEDICTDLLNRRPVKYLVLNLSMKSAASYESPESNLTNTQLWRVSGKNPVSFYLKYLFANPMDGVQKLQYRRDDGYLQQAYRVFDPATGAYDKSRRDAEPISDRWEYLNREAYTVFQNYPHTHYELADIDRTVESVARIRDLCQKTGTGLYVLIQPMYWENLQDYDAADQAAFLNALAQVTDYWDFSCSSVSFEPRYFYDATHFRNAVGTMALARIFGDRDRWVPEDFGRYVARGSVPGAPQARAMDEAEYTARVPILEYHHLTEGTPDNEDTVSLDRFRAQMAALDRAGYTPVSIWQMRDYVNKGTDLPDKPVLITFDDGYESNYELAWPVLREHGWPGTIFAIGVSLGRDTYKDTGVSMLPHFDLDQAKEMTDSGLITVASHGYDYHEVRGRDPEPLRVGILRKENESEEDYVNFLTRDTETMFSLLGEAAGFVAYPYGRTDELSRVILAQNGVFATVIEYGPAPTLIRGLPQSLYDMPRYFITEDDTPEALPERIGK